MSHPLNKIICRMFILIGLAIVSLNNLCELKAQQNWTRFHGPNGTGLAEQAELPSDISEENYLWKIKLAGLGASAPVIWDDQLFVTSCNPNSGKLTLQCFDAVTGEKRWDTNFQQAVYRVHGRNNFAASTPAVDKDHIYVTYADPDHTMLVAVDHDGNKKWDRDFGTWVSQHGFGVSPMIYKDKVIFFNSQQAQRMKPGQTPGKSRVIAVSCKDGSDIWEASLTPTRSCYAMPSVYRDAKGKEQLISCNTGDGFFSLDPETGEQNWATLPFQLRTVASTLIVDGLIIGSNGSGGGGGNYLIAIRPDENGVDPPEKVYEVRRANYVPTPVAVDGKLFMFGDKGIVQCLDLQTGKQLWQERVAKGFSGSPIATSDHVYVMDEDGNLLVIAVADEYQEVCKHSLGESTRSTPAVAKNRMYLRTDSHLICVGNKQN
jgi:outer membrane protein assembly factor BamB